MDDEKTFMYFLRLFRRLYYGVTDDVDVSVPREKLKKKKKLNKLRFLSKFEDLPNPVLVNYGVQVFGLPEMLNKEEPLLVEFTKMITNELNIKVKDVELVDNYMAIFVLFEDEKSQSMAMRKLQNVKWRGYTISPTLTDFQIVFRIVRMRCLQYMKEKKEPSILTMLDKYLSNVKSDSADLMMINDSESFQEEPNFSTRGNPNMIGLQQSASSSVLCSSPIYPPGDDDAAIVAIKESKELEGQAQNFVAKCEKATDATNFEKASDTTKCEKTTDANSEGANRPLPKLRISDIITECPPTDDHLDEESPFYLPNHVARSMLPLWSIPHHQQLMLKQSHAERLVRQAWEHVCSIPYPGELLNPMQVWSDQSRQKLGSNSVYAVDDIRYPEKRVATDTIFNIGYNIQAGVLDIGKEVKDGRVKFNVTAPMDKVPNIHPVVLTIKKRMESLVLSDKSFLTNQWRQFSIRHNSEGEFAVLLKLKAFNLQGDKTEAAKKIAEQATFLLTRDGDLNIKNIYVQISSSDDTTMPVLHRVYGEEALTATVLNCRFLVIPSACIMAGFPGFLEVVKTVLELANVNEDTRVINLSYNSDYIALNLAKRCKSVAAVYIDPFHGHVLKDNIALNEINNCNIILKSVPEALRSIFSNEAYTIDDVTVVITSSCYFYKSSIQALREKQNVTKIVLVINSTDQRYTNRLLDPFSQYLPGGDVFVPRRVVPVDILPSSARTEICVLLERVRHVQLPVHLTVAPIMRKPKHAVVDKPKRKKLRRGKKKKRQLTFGSLMAQKDFGIRPQNDRCLNWKMTELETLPTFKMKQTDPYMVRNYQQPGNRYDPTCRFARNIPDTTVTEFKDRFNRPIAKPLPSRYDGQDKIEPPKRASYDPPANLTKYEYEKRTVICDDGSPMYNRQRAITPIAPISTRQSFGELYTRRDEKPPPPRAESTNASIPNELNSIIKNVIIEYFEKQREKEETTSKIQGPSWTSEEIERTHDGANRDRPFSKSFAGESQRPERVECLSRQKEDSRMDDKYPKRSLDSERIDRRSYDIEWIPVKRPRNNRSSFQTVDSENDYAPQSRIPQSRMDSFSKNNRNEPYKAIRDSRNYAKYDTKLRTESRRSRAEFFDIRQGKLDERTRRSESSEESRSDGSCEEIRRYEPYARNRRDKLCERNRRIEPYEGIRRNEPYEGSRRNEPYEGNRRNNTSEGNGRYERDRPDELYMKTSRVEPYVESERNTLARGRRSQSYERSREMELLEGNRKRVMYVENREIERIEGSNHNVSYVENREIELFHDSGRTTFEEKRHIARIETNRRSSFDTGNVNVERNARNDSYEESYPEAFETSPDPYVKNHAFVSDQTLPVNPYRHTIPSQHEASHEIAQGRDGCEENFPGKEYEFRDEKQFVNQSEYEESHQAASYRGTFHDYNYREYPVVTEAEPYFSPAPQHTPFVPTDNLAIVERRFASRMAKPPAKRRNPRNNITLTRFQNTPKRRDQPR